MRVLPGPYRYLEQTSSSLLFFFFKVNFIEAQISQLWKQVFHSFQKQILDPAGPTLAPKDSEFHEW